MGQKCYLPSTACKNDKLHYFLIKKFRCWKDNPVEADIFRLIHVTRPVKRNISSQSYQHSKTSEEWPENRCEKRGQSSTQISVLQGGKKCCFLQRNCVSSLLLCSASLSRREAGIFSHIFYQSLFCQNSYLKHCKQS